MEHNPYAPPSVPAEPPPPGLVFSSEGVEVVASMAKWMRALSTFYYVALAFVLLGGGCGAIALFSQAGAAALAVVLGMGLAALLVGLSATWLRDAAGYFENGVVGDDEFSLGQGFRKLRAYFILFGIIGILGLLGNIIEALKVL